MRKEADLSLFDRCGVLTGAGALLLAAAVSAQPVPAFAPRASLRLPAHVRLRALDAPCTETPAAGWRHAAATVRRPMADRARRAHARGHSPSRGVMVQYRFARLDASFAALSDATRRGVLEQLARADASITELAEKFRLTLTGMKKHVGVLERAGLVTTEKLGRVRICRLGPRRLEEEAAWIERYRQLWAARFDELDRVLEELKQRDRAGNRRKKKR